EGRVEGKHVVVGGNTFVHDRSGGVDPHTLHDGLAPQLATVAVAVEGQVAGVIVLEDPVRADAATLLSDLRSSGIGRVVLASGDRREIAEAVGSALGMDAVHGELKPEQKVALVA